MTEKEMNLVFSLWENLKDNTSEYLIKDCAKIAMDYEFDIECLPENLCWEVEREMRRIEKEKYEFYAEQEAYDDYLTRIDREAEDLAAHF